MEALRATSVAGKRDGDEFIPIGTRVRMKRGLRTVFGWNGTATMLDFGAAIKDGYSEPELHTVTALPEQWTRCRDQTPNPEHAAAVAAARRIEVSS